MIGSEEYRKEFAEQAYNYCLLGATDEQLAMFFDVPVTTIASWQIRIPSFNDACRRGKDIADARVAHALFENAVGYTYQTTRQIRGQEVAVDVYVPPQVKAQEFWLTNRRPDLWRKQIDITAQPALLPGPADLKDAARRIAFALAAGTTIIDSED